MGKEEGGGQTLKTGWNGRWPAALARVPPQSPCGEALSGADCRRKRDVVMKC